jgi:acyl carrier protein
MDNAEIRERLMRIVADVFKADPQTLAGSTRFIQDLHGRSLTMAALVAAVESEFGIHTTARETNQNKTIDETVDYIQGKLQEQARK